MSSINDIPAGLRVPAQVPLDGKVYFASQAALANLGPGNNLAYTYFKGMIAYCAQQQTRWEWREPSYPGEPGLIPSNFVYPTGLSVFGINYSNKAYNFFPIPGSVLQATPTQLLNQLEMSFDWKKGTIQDYTRVPADMPLGVTNNQHTRNGFVGYGKPIEVAGNVVHPQYEGILGPQNEKLIEAYIYNLGVKIKDYSTIANYNPVLVISKYTPSMKKAPNVPTPTFPDNSWSKGSYKFSQDNDTVRLTRVPIQASYQVIDFGQEHYFKTSRSFQSSSTFSANYTNPLLRTRGCKRHNHQTTPLKLFSKAFVYLQFHIEITVAGNTYLSPPLGRLKMLLEFKPLVGEVYNTVPGEIISADFNTIPYQTTRIYFKHT
jgi:hypothetical protein